MCLSIGLLLATYLGTRIYGQVKKDEAKPAAKKKRGGKKTAEKKLLTEGSPPPVENQVALYTHYSKTSMASMAFFAFGTFIPFLRPIGLIGYIYSALPYMRDVEKALLKDRKVNVDVLFFLGDLLTLGIGQNFAAAFGLWIMHTGKKGVAKAKDNSKKMIASIFQELPSRVWLLVDGVAVEIPLQDVRANDVIVVQGGEVIPVDGSIKAGRASIDQRALTGESQPVEKQIGDPVLANTVVLSGYIEIAVEKSGEETTASRIEQVLLHATDFKSRVQLKGEMWADKATFPMLVTAGICWPLFGAQSTAVFINSHMGNRIRLLAPLATLKEISATAKHGVLVKDGRALEALSDVTTVLFDKTGTLTTDEPEVIRIIPCARHNENDILGYAAAAEHKLNHPIARAILKKAEERRLPRPEIDDSQYQMGYGVTIVIDGKAVKVGSIRFMTGEGIPIPRKIESGITASHEKGNTMVLVAEDEKIVGAIELQPRIRPEAKKIIGQLRKAGVRHLAVVSGDHLRPTRRLAEDLGLDDYFAEVLPEEKAGIVEALQKKGEIVCFIGDGINDAIAMKKADVSISLSGASALAQDAAEVIFMDGDLAHMGYLFNVSKKLNTNLKNILSLTVAPGIINVLGAFVLNFNVLTSLIVSVGFGYFATTAAMNASKSVDSEEERAAQKKMESKKS